MNADDDKDKDDRNGRDDNDVRAAEYVLGTLDPDERSAALTRIAGDPEFAALVHKWERRLGELNVLVAPVEPPAETWDKIKTRISTSGGDMTLQLDAAVAAGEAGKVSEKPVEPPRRGQSLTVVPAGEEGADVIALTRRLRRWRGVATLAGVIAAALVALVVVREIRPELLPAPLRGKPVIQVVEVEKPVEVPSPRPAQYVAVLQKDAASPAFLLTFDLDKHTLAVRRVGAERQAGKSYELWLIADKSSGPQSLGLIEAGEFTVRPEPAYDQVTLSAATYAVSLEPEGGSPDGKPTEVLYMGKLIQTTPRGFDGPSP
jgi:anti-sigma-K factor RskA